MLNSVFQAARAFLQTEYGEAVFDELKVSVVDREVQVTTSLSRFLSYFFMEGHGAGLIFVDDREMWRSSRYPKLSKVVKIYINLTERCFTVRIEIFDENQHDPLEFFSAEFIQNRVDYDCALPPQF